MKNSVNIIIVAVFTALLYACSASTTEKREVSKLTSENSTDEEFSNIIYTKYNIPLPADLFMFIFQSKVPFDIDLLCPELQPEKYKKDTKQALALGIYTADAAYCSIYGKQQDLMTYYNCATKLADKLDVDEGFGFQYIKRLQDNIDNPDSLSAIAGESYWRACNFLEENQKNNILPFVIYSGWIESQYLAMKSNDLPQTKEKIFAQKAGLMNLINYFYEVMVESTAFYYNYDIKLLILKLDQLKQIFDKAELNNSSDQLYQDIEKSITSLRKDIVIP